MTSDAPTTTYGLLGMLAVRSWTGYEMTKQLRRSLRFVWPSSEGHLYREQKRLVDLGWATVVEEPAGQRTRKRYEITPDGEAALQEWLGSEPGPPRFEIEGILRIFFADQGTTEELVQSLETTASSSRNMLNELHGYVDEYLADGGPLWMLEQGIGGPESERLEFRERVMYPERLHVIARAIDITTRLLSTIETFAEQTAAEFAGWSTPTDPDLTAPTRRLLEEIQNRNHDG
jgi:DNA-binding PadR family transcriptional regulator